MPMPLRTAGFRNNTAEPQGAKYGGPRQVFSPFERRESQNWCTKTLERTHGTVARAYCASAEANES